MDNISWTSLAPLLGELCTDEGMVSFVESLGKKVPKSYSDEMKYVVAKKAGLELAFEGDILNDLTPVVPKTKVLDVPRLSVVWFTKKYPNALPHGVELESSEDALREKLGAPTDFLGVRRRPVWRFEVEGFSELYWEYSKSRALLAVKQARRLSEANSSSLLFWNWAVRRGFSESASPTEFFDIEALRAAFPRGLWDTFLIASKRESAISYFRRLGDSWIRDDLLALFGEDDEGNLAIPEIDGAMVEKVDALFDRRLG